MSAVSQDVIRAPSPDKAEMLKAINALFDPQDVIELRAFPKGRKRTDAGYFDAEHRGKLAEEAIRLSSADAAVYVNLNPIDPQLLGRYANRIEQYAQATATDANVTRRRWLLLDFDPTRPKNTSATAAQEKAARDCARQCYQTLKREGWPEPLTAESGNGVHLLYLLDLPNDTESRDLIKGALAGLARRFDNDAVSVDQSVCNAGRIVKLYGTVANKGDHTRAAPWRLSRLILTPAREAVVTVDQLQALHVLRETESMHAEASQPGFNLENFLARLGIGYTHDLHEGSDRYKLAHCPFNSEHGKGEAAILRRPDGTLGFKCQHNSCANKHWQDVRALVDGPHEARKRPTANAKPADRERHQSKSENTAVGAVASRIRYRRASEIEMLPIRWLWRDRIARDTVTLLAGHPGLGKSQVTASIAAIVSTSGTWPVDRTSCETGNVVILSAEDGAERVLVPRLKAAGADLARVVILSGTITSEDATANERIINIKTDLAALRNTLAEIGDVALVIIDPITAYLGETDSHKNAEIRGLLTPLTDMAEKHGAAVVCVTHLSKGGGNDALLRVIGSVAFVAASRAAFLIAKDTDNDKRRLFLPLKVNYGDDHTGLAYEVQTAQLQSAAGLIETSCVVWSGEAVTTTADEVMRQSAGASGQTATDEAVEWLRAMLTDEGGKVDRREVMKAAEAMGFKARTIHRARKKLRLTVEQVGFGKDKHSLWMVPEYLNCANNPQSCQTKTVGTNGTNGKNEAIPEDDAAYEAEV